ncbi:hypothetical protein ElyMa_003620700 [Elysia marginata]|uniref:Reelin domain-containing protein n=1 Tax=Elysia marginata TaxID=1093978 RepID=A0AAV4ESP9_9GAST|nr:hypothetical protein ElyMa_003620700 [Elysia marginata]
MDGKVFVQFTGFLLLWSVSLEPTQARLFTLNTPGTSSACIMVDITFKAEVQALRGGTVVSTKYLTSDDKQITTTGVCRSGSTEIVLEFGGKTIWYIAFQQREHEPTEPVGQYRGLQFVPSQLFNQTTSISKQLNFFDPRPVYQTDIKDSFFCPTKDQTRYMSTHSPNEDASFNVDVTVFSIHSQGFDIKNNQFGPKETCSN